MVKTTLKTTLNSDVCYPKIFLFSFMDVSLNFLKYLTSVLFPRIVISAFIGFIL